MSFAPRYAYDVDPGPHKLSPHQIDALLCIDREGRYTQARVNNRTLTVLVRKGLVAWYRYRGIRGGRKVARYITPDVGAAEVARINAELDARGY